MNREHLSQLKRPDLQTLAKRNNIRATQKNEAIIEELLKIDMPSITGVRALEQVMGPAAMKRQKVMMRSGLCPRGPARDRPMAKAAAPKRERTQRNKKSKLATEKVESAATGAVASTSTSGVGPSNDREGTPQATNGEGSAAPEKQGECSATLQAETESTPVSTPALKTAKDTVCTERTLSIGIKERMEGVTSLDDDLREEEEVEVMTSLENIVVEPASSPVRAGRHGKENKKRGAEDDVCDSPRPAKRARTSTVL
ncbi:hypothetical protein L226DRAFT_163454 [Lentinus tigrinus ALCF2SS1-7]|uniref:Uncharacterized protein n=1 Tax=Lentinus tigrinus ALCF2SS1-6 TaxID=1328759 RepID=A0A5C2S2X7_9APHY|nr:hypothetical protein L227DRAFT_223577 [Lentinus tigrinus ALCF2SS1-6]RPD71849.1 hypothetical protein L226DRAFT_163454 [Lentinus tigrinus ALCF2SS1-7]